MSNRLTEQALTQLDKELDACIPYHLLDGFSQESALLHVMRYHAFVTSNGGYGSFITKARHDRFREVVHILTTWCITRCKPSGRLPEQNTNADNWSRFEHLFNEGLSYSYILDIMNLLWSDWQDVHQETSEKFVVRYRSEKQMSQEICDFVTSVPEPSLDSIDFSLFPKIISLLAPRLEEGQLIYNLSDEAFELARDGIVKDLESPWHLDPTWSLSIYTIGDFREFWLQLLTFSFINVLAYSSIVSTEGHPVCSSVPVRRKRDWTAFICQFSSLKRKVVEAIIDDLTLNPKLLVKTNKKWDYCYQPFVKLGGFLALNTRIVAASNAERNMWDLTSLLRPSTFDSLSSKKERHWCNELQSRFEQLGTKVKRLKTDDGDVDLLVIDETNRFAVAIQLKFQMAADRFNQRQIDEVKKGQNQVTRGLAWMLANSKKTAQKLKMTEQDVHTLRFETLVLTKANMFLGYIPDTSPVLNESLLFWMIETPHRKTLKDAWEVAKNQSFLPALGKHFKEERKIAKFGVKEFEVSSLPPISEWNPKYDIVFSK